MTVLRSMLRKKMAVLVLVAVSAIGAFATLGDGKIKHENPKRSLLSDKSALAGGGSFSLRSGYSYRGSHVINPLGQKYLIINTTVTYQKGHTSYTVPLKKKMILDNKITFNPNAATRN